MSAAIFAVGLALCLSACQPGCDWWAEGCDRPPNLLLILADDVGTEVISTWGLADDAAPTPTLDALAEDGIRFDRAFSFAWCSPTRASILTGRYPPIHYDMGRAIKVEVDSEVSLPEEAVTLPEVLAEADDRWSSALVGKWHVTKVADDALTAPLRQGFDTWRGNVANLYRRHAYDGQGQQYDDWERVVDGQVARSGAYATSKLVDDALEVMDDLDAPWLLWMAFQSAHEPFHDPPRALHGYDLEALEGQNPTPVRYRAMIEALDTELGRLLRWMTPSVRRNTLIVFLGDNGSAPQSRTGRFEGRPVKSTVYELGVRVPMIVSGTDLPGAGQVVDELVHTTDLFATLLDVAGVPDDRWPADLDAQSFSALIRDPGATGPRDVVYSEAFDPNGPGPRRNHLRMIRDHRYKLMEEQGLVSFYDLAGDDLLEGDPLPLTTLDEDARQAYEALSARLTTGDY